MCQKVARFQDQRRCHECHQETSGAGGLAIAERSGQLGFGAEYRYTSRPAVGAAFVEDVPEAGSAGAPQNHAGRERRISRGLAEVRGLAAHVLRPA